MSKTSNTPSKSPFAWLPLVGALLLAACSSPDLMYEGFGHTRVWNLPDGSGLIAGQSRHGIVVRAMGGNHPNALIKHLGHDASYRPACGATAKDGSHWLIFFAEEGLYLWSSRGDWVVLLEPLTSPYRPGRTPRCVLLPDKTGAWYQLSNDGRESVYRLEDRGHPRELTSGEEAVLFGTPQHPKIWNEMSRRQLRVETGVTPLSGDVFATAGETIMVTGLSTSQSGTGSARALLVVVDERGQSVTKASVELERLLHSPKAGGIPGHFVWGGQTRDFWGVQTFWDEKGREITWLIPNPNTPKGPVGVEPRVGQLVVIDGTPLLFYGPHGWILD